ncbi:MAG: DNA integrity scanning protein DisA nucleotide-binding domain protein, partial [Treponema sp.]|nr:DNA integrity scanning protein DisA nucleotide-binding domain protein [Treponema sp.]
REKRGMLVVFSRRVNIKNIIETGTRLNADISFSLIVKVFEFDTPLHDGAMVIQNNRIVAAGCFLPLSEQQDIKKSFGTRHRAALGISEQSDVVVLVVSEETGAISLAFDGRIYYDLSPIEVTRKLKELLDRGTRKGESDAALPQIPGEVSLELHPAGLNSIALNPVELSPVGVDSAGVPASGGTVTGRIPAGSSAPLRTAADSAASGSAARNPPLDSGKE